MNPDRLLAHYEKIADAPDAIPRLRRFILDLAVRGKLVPQDPNDEPASELLKRIATEKARLVKEGKSTTKGPLSVDEFPFSLPFGWLWSRVGELCTKTGSGRTPRGGKEVYRKVGVPFLRSQNVYDNGLRLDDVAYIGPDVHLRMAGTAVRTRDLLLNITGGSLGRCCRVPDEFGEANVSQHVAIIRLAVSEMAEFLHRLVLSPYFQAFIFDEQTGAGRGGLPKYKMDRIPVAVPPLPEQRRIVAKVDEFMALCDRLEAARTEREETRDQLSAGSLARLNTPDSNPAVFQKHATFALDNLIPLTTRPDQIKALRQAILNLAVRGKLAPQVPKDEPASELLKRIAAEKARLVKMGKAKTRKSKRIDRFNTPLSELPKSWKWTTLGDLFLYDAGIKRQPQNLNQNLWLLELEDIEKDSGRLLVRVFTSERQSKSTKSEFRVGDILYGKLRPYLNKVLVADRPGYSTTEIVALRPFLRLCLRYCALALRRPDFVEYVTRLGQGTKMPRLRREDASIAPFPLPPLPEQRRIVAKVDELMDLCDRLETSLGAVDTCRHRLLESLLFESLN